jgi:cobalamin biosynthesis Mg chelatase CobN
MGAGYLEAGIGAAGAAGAGQTVLQSGIAALTDPSTLARITLLAATGDMTGLSAAEAELVNLRKQELQQIASTNQELFDQQVEAARNFMQMAAQNAPNPQQAFAETKIATERQLAEQTRGLGAGEAALAQRRAAIRGTQTGATAAAAEEARGRGTQTSLMQAGLGALPSSAPEGYAGLALPMYEDLAERARQARADLTYGVTRAAPNLFGRIA